MEDGQCVDAIASPGLPVHLRPYADFVWQRDPFAIGRTYGRSGHRQSPGTDLTEAFWLARTYGFSDAGAGQVLAWRELGPCDP